VTRPLSILVFAAAASACAAGSPGDVAREPRRDIALLRDAVTFEAVVPANATLESLLRQQLPEDVTTAVVDAVRGVFNPRHIRAERPYAIVRGLDGIVREFRYGIDADRLLRVVFDRGADAAVRSAVSATVVALPKEYEPDAVNVAITGETPSLVQAFDAEGESLQLPLHLADVFAGEVDFNSDLQRGDRAQVLFARATRSGEFIGYGPLDAAVLTLGSRQLTAIRFDGSDGKPAYYDEHGRSLRRQFLKSPLPLSPRVTSGFSYNRFHPVFGTRRPHLGVDYGAPAGTRVNAVASGVVEFAAWSGQSGRMVRIRHAGGYETAYLHLSSFGPGVRPGTRVQQGQMIGRVGQSGAATGPHLDYRIIRNGRYVNPVAEHAKMPPGEPIAPERLAEFVAVRDRALAELARRLDPPVDLPSVASTR
jgi:murein DD-endopeptidase MepM/ murein hydrolase activator NlpD